MIALYNTILYEPLFNLLVFLYNVVPFQDIGLAIILLTLIIKLVLFPLTKQSIKAQKALQELQPKMNELKEKYKDNKEEMSKQMMKLYSENKVNPLSSCLPLLLQFPILIAVYQVFRHGLNSDNLDVLYSFVANPGHINSISLGFIDLAVPSIALAVLAGIAQFFQAKMLPKQAPAIKSKGSKDESIMASLNKNMTYFMPVMTIIIGIQLPSGLALYWLLTTLLTILQQHLIFRKKDDDSAKTEPKDEKPVLPSSTN